MAKESDLVLALEFITRGARAEVPPALRTAVFALEDFQVEAEKLREKAHDWTTARGIQGLGIGPKISKGQPTEELAVRVYVEKKKARAKVANPVPKTVAVPEVGAVPTDVVEIGRVELETFRERVRPAMPGSGLGHKDVTVGTFGCLVRKRGSRTGLYILSNSHVLANSGLAAVGDPIVQPGTLDGGKVAADGLATLAEFVPFDFADGFPNLVDAALARVNPRSVRPEIRIAGVKPAGVSQTLKRDMIVKKVGRTTDLTTGVVQDLHYRMRLPYPTSRTDPRVRKSAGLRDLVLCTRYTAGGDSGSLVLNDRDRAVGLHFAGSPASSIFCRIKNVFDALDVVLA
jgi:hypothetical protein